MYQQVQKKLRALAQSSTWASMKRNIFFLIFNVIVCDGMHLRSSTTLDAPKPIGLYIDSLKS